MNRSIIWYIALLIFISFPKAGRSADFTFEFGTTIAPLPSGGYTDDFKSISRASYLPSPRLDIRYTFDSGFTIGREIISGYYDVKFQNDPSTTFSLEITLPAFTLGWAFGENPRYLASYGITQLGSVRLLDKDSGDKVSEDNISSEASGVAVDIGEDNLGIVVALRNVTMKTDNLFETNKSFDASGLYLSLAARYRF